jgi:hypothetical protein
MRKFAIGLLATALALAAADPSEAVRRRAFVTSVSGTGNLASWPDAGGQAGLAAGNQICRNRAAAAALPNANSYRVWLSSASTDAYCHLRGQTGKRSAGCAGGPPLATGPWFRSTEPTSQTVAAALDQLVDPGAEILAPALFDEFGDAVDSGGPVPSYWTGTNSDGAVYPDGTCAGWVSAAADHTGIVGSALGTAQLWTLSTAYGCDATLRLLCFEPGTSDPVVKGWPAPASIVFLTSAEGPGDLGAWAEAGGETGLAAGDAICRTQAAGAKLPAPDSFVAWLSDGTAEARDRLTSDGPFRRPDGFLVAESEADLLDGSNGGSIHQYESGAYHSGGGGGEIFTGTLEDGTASGLDCSNWTISTPINVTKGVAGTTRTARWTTGSSTSCSFSQQLYCFSNVVTLFWDGFESGDTDRWSGVTP